MPLRMNRSTAGAALAFAIAVGLVGCAEPPTAIPTLESVRGLKPSGAVTIGQLFIAGTGVGSGNLTFGGRTYPFTLVGTLIGPGALSALEASGTVYNLTDVSQFSGSYIQGSAQLAVAASIRPLPGEIWLKNNHGVIIRLQGQQTGLALTRGRYEIFIRLGP